METPSPDMPSFCKDRNCVPKYSKESPTQRSVLGCDNSTVAAKKKKVKKETPLMKTTLANAVAVIELKSMPDSGKIPLCMKSG